MNVYCMHVYLFGSNVPYEMVYTSLSQPLSKGNPLNNSKVLGTTC